ncbi:MAG: ATP synthase F1 subunit delta [Bacteroidetes bacterium]|nr:ATP synthase F1 subunit delta [Bacteroidota bacterium]MBS1670615.1 ATP synthase F1 subunit delta [Bacteroidota bacterium]
MPNPRLAQRYAKSLIDLAIEKNQLEQVFADMQYIKAVCNASRDFTVLLSSPVIKGDKKAKIIEAVTKGKITELTLAFNMLLVAKGRENVLLEIAQAFIEQYNTLKGISKVKLTTAVAISNDIKKAITDKVSKEAGLTKIELETKVDESLIGGFVLEFNNNLVDASVARDLRDIKKQFGKNVYVNTMH